MSKTNRVARILSDAISHTWNPITRAARRHDRTSGLESLEQRTLFALLGVAPDVPITVYNSTGVTAFNSATGAMDITATPLLFVKDNSSPVVPVTGTPSLAVHFRVNNTGALIGGVPGDDLVMTGDIDADGDTVVDYSGTLLTAEITGFGYQDSGLGGTTDNYDLRFTVTGGALASLLAGNDLGMTVESENSTFDGTFTTDFGGGAKGNVGGIPQQVGRISGIKYNDLTGNGLTGDDTPLGNTTINLYRDVDNNGQLTAADGAAIASTVTAVGTGAYSFDNLQPGAYIVQEVVPTGYARTTPTSSSGIYVIQLAPGGDVGGNNFANVKLGSIGGTKYKDLTGNGLTGDDTPLSGTTINLYRDVDNNGQLTAADGAAIASTVTNGTGSFQFDNLLPGNYIVQEVVPAGYARTTPTGTSGIYVIALSAGSVVTGKNFANVQLGCISGYKYKDVCGDGLTNDDTGLGGTTIKLYLDRDNSGTVTAADGAPVATTVTASNGSYSFGNLLPGKYLVQEVVPNGYIRTAPTNTDTYVVTLGAGANITGRNFANFKIPDCHICNVKYCIDGCYYTTLSGNTNQGSTIKVTFTVPYGYTDTVSLISYKAPGPTWDANVAGQQAIYEVATGTFGPGTYTLTVHNPDSYYQCDFVCGCPIKQFGPVGSNIFYTSQGRLESADNDGLNSDVDDMSAGPAFWSGTRGQNLIKSFNGSSTATTLATWLANSFPKLYGSYAGTNKLSGKNNAGVASLMLSLYTAGSTKSADANVLATALSVYATTSSLGGSAGAAYFDVTSAGLGAATFNVQSWGGAFGITDGSNRTVMQLLQLANSNASSSGVLNNGYSSLKAETLSMFDFINDRGGVV